MKRTTTLSCLTIGFTVACAAAGCDWRELDQVVEDAPVLSLGPPKNYGQDDVGRLILSLPPAGGAGRFMFFSTVQPHAALVEFDETGMAQVHNVPGASLLALANRPARSALFLAGQKRIFLGVPDHGMTSSGFTGQVHELTLGEGPSFSSRLFAGPRSDRPQELQFGLGLAGGDLGAGSPNFEDLVVVSKKYLTIFPDGISGTGRVASDEQTCNIESADTTDARYQINRTVVVADLFPDLGGQGIAEAVVGVPRALPGQTRGKVMILHPQPDPVGFPMIPVACPVQIDAPAPAASMPPYQGILNFGSALAVGDFGSRAGPPDGIVDLAVGAPPDRVFVYFGPLSSTMPNEPSVTISPPPGVLGAFGLRLLAMNYDAKPGDELVVSIPDAPDGTVSQAGRVLVYKTGVAGVEPTLLTGPRGIHKFEPKQDLQVGIGLTTVNFQAPGCGKAAHLLIAGGVTEVLTYFTAPGSGWSDPRCPRGM